MDPAEGVGQKRSAEQVYPAKMSRSVNGVRKADDEVCQADEPEHLSDPVQLGDFGVDIGVEVEGPEL